MASSEGKLTVEHLDVDNFATWSIRMQAFLMVKGLWDNVTGTSTDTAANKKALAQIILHVKDHHLATLSRCTTARNAWETLKSTYEAKTNARKLLLRQALTQLKMGATEPLTVYAARAKDLQTQLSSAGDAASDQDIALQFLAGLPPAYGMISTVLTAGDQELKIDTMLPKLLQVEQQMQPTKRPSEAALFAKPKRGFGKGRTNSGRGRDSHSNGNSSGHSRNSHNSHSNNHNDKRSRTCYYCGKPGHFAEECRQKAWDMQRQGGGRPPQHSQYGAIALSASTEADMAYSSSSTRWVLDTGASRHMTADASLLSNMRPTADDITITFGNGSTGKAVATGEVFLATSNATFQLTDVLYIPQATENLISVRQATQRGLDFKFSADHCEISRDGRRLATAPSMGESIYYMTGWSKRLDNSALTARSKETAQLWHERFGHLGYDSLARLTSMVNGMHITAEEFKTAGEGHCEPCLRGKQHRAPFKPSSSSTARPLALVHTDLCGPLPLPSQGGSNYFLTLLDDHSKFSAVQPIARKSDTAAAVKDTLNLLQNLTGHRVQRLRCDNGSEFINEELESYCRQNGIKLETTVRYTPQQNGAAERLNRTLMDKVRPMLAASGLPKYLWADAVVTANYVRNRSPVSDRDKTPYELFFDTKPDVAHLRTFGVRCFAVTPKPLRTKLDDTSESGRFIGYPASTKGYKILLDSGRVIISRDATFMETGGSSDSPPGEPTPSEVSDEEEADGEPVGAEEQPTAASGSRRQPPPAHGKQPKRAATDVPASIWRDEGYKITGRKRDMGEAHAAIIHEPTSLEEALTTEQAELWQQAADEEMASLLANGTWELEPVPPGVKPIPVKWVFKVKRDANGNVERYKARLVAKGFRQQEGIDYEEVFAPVSKYSTVRATLALAAAQDHEIHQLDIKTAFLYGELEEDVWTEQPPGYESGSPGTACHLRKSLYGLKQAPRVWHAKLSAELEKMGFQPSAADPALFIKPGAAPVKLLTYVDDILIITGDTQALTSTKSGLLTTFEGRDLGPASFFLGMDIKRDRAARTISLGQSRLTMDLLDKYGMTESKPLSTPLSTATKLTKDGEPLDTTAHGYSQLIGSLMYLSVCTRPDIAQAVGALARYMAAPTTTHWQAAKAVLRYLAGTRSHGITYGGTNLEAYCDADYAGDLDTRRSTTGYVYLLGGGAISWSSRLQPTVAASTTEAEYMAAAYAIKEGLWLRTLLTDLGLKTDSISINADNQGAIKLLKNPVFSMRSKHIDIIYHFARERVTRKDITFKYIPTTKMVADALTKPLPAAKLDFCRTAMGIASLEHSSSD